MPDQKTKWKYHAVIHAIERTNLAYKLNYVDQLNYHAVELK